MDERSIDRRGFLTSAGLAVSAVGLTGWAVEAAEMTDEEKRNVKVLSDFLTARWTVPFNADGIGAFLAEDCIRGTEDIRLRGRQSILDELIKGYADTEAADFKIIQTWARGPLLMNERLEHTKLRGRPNGAWHGLGFFNLKDGKIKEWRTFTLRAGA
jgi:limonene-1,2-epoxide hydrolase